MKRNYSAINLEDAMQLVPAKRTVSWKLDASPRPPSEILIANLNRLKVFDLKTTEQAKTLLIDALFAEIVPEHPGLKVWKAMSLETDALVGVTDYLISPDYAYLSTPLLCVAEAKRDDFVKGQAQCVAEMAACRWKNRQEGFETDILGIVSNGGTWLFYKLTQTNEVYESEQYSLNDMSELLGALDVVCAECAANLP